MRYPPLPLWLNPWCFIFRHIVLFERVLLDSVRILVAYDSLTGNVEKMAHAVAEGARELSGVVDVCRVAEVELDKVSGYDGIAFGSPTHCGTLSLKMNEFINTRLHKRYWG